MKSEFPQDEGAGPAEEQIGFRVKASLGFYWLRLIDAGDTHALAARDRLLQQCSDFTRESVCAAFIKTAKADIIRAHFLGGFILRNRRHPAARILLRRLSRKICL